MRTVRLVTDPSCQDFIFTIRDIIEDEASYPPGVRTVGCAINDQVPQNPNTPPRHPHPQMTTALLERQATAVHPTDAIATDDASAFHKQCLQYYKILKHGVLCYSVQSVEASITFAFAHKQVDEIPVARSTCYEFCLEAKCEPESESITDQ